MDNNPNTQAPEKPGEFVTLTDAVKLPEGLVDLAEEQLNAVPGSPAFQRANQALLRAVPQSATWMVEEALYQAQVALHNESIAAGGPGYQEPTPPVLPQQQAYLDEVAAQREAEGALAAQAPPIRRYPAPRAKPEMTEFFGEVTSAGVSAVSTGPAPGPVPTVPEDVIARLREDAERDRAALFGEKPVETRENTEGAVG